MLVDGDGHVLEDVAAIAARLPARYQAGLTDRMRIDLFPPIDHFHAQAFRLHGSERGFVDADGWLAFLEDVGIERSVLYPSLGLAAGKIRDSNWARVLIRAYNDWLHDAYLSRHERFEGMALLPLQDIDAATAELARGVTELGMRGAMLPANSLPLHLGAKFYWPLYELANELDCALAVHGGSHEGLGFDDMNVFAVAHAFGHPFGQLISMAGLVVNGVFDKWPRLRIAFLESGIAWILFALERLDESFETHVPIEFENLFQLGPAGDVRDYILGLLRSGRIQIGCEGAEPDLPYVIEQIGEAALFYSSDFPHEVTNESCKRQLASLRERLDDHAARAVLGANAARFYHLQEGTQWMS